MPVVWKFWVKSVMVTRVAESTDSPAFCRPMKAMNRPIPTETARFKGRGMELKIASRTLVRERIMKMIPSINTAKSATCQEKPIGPHTVYAM